MKTNRRASRGVSETLRGGQLKSLPGPSAVYRELRPLTQLRETFVSERVALKQRSKSLLLLAGSEFPPAPVGSQWSVLVKDHLRTLPCSTTVRFQLEQVLDSLAVNAQQVVKTTTEIRRFCQHAPELGQCLKSLRTLPGIGWGVARQLVARSGDGRELRHLRHLAGFLGLVPTAPSPGDRTERGSIPHTGDPRLRSNLSHAAWSALRQDGELRECFRSVCQTPPRPLAARVAMVAVARTRSVRSAVVWMNQRASEISKPLPSAPLTPEETGPQGTPRRPAEPGANTS